MKPSLLILAGYLVMLACLEKPLRAGAAPLFGDFSDYVAMNHVVVEGTLVSLRHLHRPFAGGCGIAGRDLAWISSTEYVVHVETVVIGSMVDSAITVVGPESETPIARTGQRVFVSAKRVCNDGWQLWGYVLPVDPQGKLSFASDGDALYLEGYPRERQIPYVALRNSLAHTKLRNPLFAFTDSKAIALLRIRGLEVVAPGEIKLTCDSLGWVAGSLGIVPEEITFSPQSWCFFRRAAAGDTIIVPLANPSRSLHFTVCPRELVLDHGFVPALGTTLADISAALREADHVFAIRQFRSK